MEILQNNLKYISKNWLFLVKHLPVYKKQKELILKIAYLNLLKILQLVSIRFYYSFIIDLAEFWQFQHYV